MKTVGLFLLACLYLFSGCSAQDRYDRCANLCAGKVSRVADLAWGTECWCASSSNSLGYSFTEAKP